MSEDVDPWLLLAEAYCCLGLDFKASPPDVQKKILELDSRIKRELMKRGY